MTQEAETDGSEFETNLVYRVSFSLYQETLSQGK